MGFVYGIGDLISQNSEITMSIKTDKIQIENNTAEHASTSEQDNQPDDHHTDGVKKEYEDNTLMENSLVGEQIPIKTGCTKGQLLLNPTQLG